MRADPALQREPILGRELDRRSSSHDRTLYDPNLTVKLFLRHYTRDLVRRDLESARDFGAGHGVARADWQTIVRAILKHTGGLTTMGL
jgi:hypothetical protein